MQRIKETTAIMLHYEPFLVVSPQNMPSRLDLSNATDTTTDFPKLGKDSYRGREEGKNVHPLDNLNVVAGSSGKLQ